MSYLTDRAAALEATAGHLQLRADAHEEGAQLLIDAAHQARAEADSYMADATMLRDLEAAVKAEDLASVRTLATMLGYEVRLRDGGIEVLESEQAEVHHAPESAAVAVRGGRR